jgi:transcriptional regulator with XRE-family HTH domain
MSEKSVDNWKTSRYAEAGRNGERTVGFVRTNKFAHVVKQEMIKKGISLRQLAGECDISPAYLSLVLNEKREPPQPEIIDKITRALGLAPPILHMLAGYLPRNDRRWDGLFKRLRTMSDAEVDNLIQYIDSTKQGQRR